MPLNIQELYQTRDHKDELTGIAMSLELNKAASCGDNWWVYACNDVWSISIRINGHRDTTLCSDLVILC